jgi:hypothetical protein
MGARARQEADLRIQLVEMLQTTELTLRDSRAVVAKCPG